MDYVYDVQLSSDIESTMTIDVKYMCPNMTPLEFKEGSDWVDLRAGQDYILTKGEHALIRLGVGMKLPDGYEAHVAPRSSTFKNWGILQTNSVGVIDESYCGNEDEWMMSVYATRDTEIHKNDRICQFRIMKKQPKITFNKVNVLAEDSRGGFGSTGIN